MSPLLFIAVVEGISRKSVTNDTLMTLLLAEVLTMAPDGAYSSPRITDRVDMYVQHTRTESNLGKDGGMWVGQR